MGCVALSLAASWRLFSTGFDGLLTPSPAVLQIKPAEAQCFKMAQDAEAKKFAVEQKAAAEAAEIKLSGEGTKF